jgi:hypothetical protein
MTNASIGLRLTHVYHNCFYTKFTASIPATVTSGLAARCGKAALFHVNQQSKFDHNHCVSARNEFADNSHAAYPERIGSALHGLPAPAASNPPPSARLAGGSRREDMPPLAYAQNRDRQMCRRNAAGKLPGWFRCTCVPAQFLFRRSGKSRYPLVSLTIAQFPSDPADFNAAPPVDTSKRRICDGGQLTADEAARPPALSLHLAGRTTHEARHPCVVKTSCNLRQRR